MRFRGGRDSYQNQRLSSPSSRLAVLSPAGSGWYETHRLLFGTDSMIRPLLNDEPGSGTPNQLWITLLTAYLNVSLFKGRCCVLYWCFMCCSLTTTHFDQSPCRSDTSTGHCVELTQERPQPRHFWQRWSWKTQTDSQCVLQWKNIKNSKSGKMKMLPSCRLVCELFRCRKSNTWLFYCSLVDQQPNK